MQPLQDRFLEAVAAERARLRSRRALLAGGAKLVGGGAVALTVFGAPGAMRLARAQDFTDDLDILNYALTLEHLEFAFYRDGLDEFDEEAFAAVFGDDEDDATEDAEDDDDDDDGSMEEAAEDAFLAARANFEAIRDHEEAHVQALTDTITQLGGTPVTEGEYDFGYDDLEGFVEVAQALENTGVAAYAGAAPFVTDDAILSAALGIHSVEARHAAYLNLLNGESAFPDAVDEALTRAEVLEIAGEFIVGEGDAATEAPDASAAPAATAEPAAGAAAAPTAVPSAAPSAPGTPPA